LILGDRYQSFYYPEVARAAAPYLDAISSNLNASWNDGTFVRFQLETLHALTGKPVLVSEFYAAAMENRSENKNSQGGFPVAGTQADRAHVAHRTLQALLRIPYVIGADWFAYSDEPTHGREDGENFNFGLVDIHDQAYEPTTAVFSSVEASRLKFRTSPGRSDASSGVPRAPDDPFGQFEYGRALAHWDRERGFVKPVSEFPLADLYVCWDSRAIYLGVYGTDIIEDAYYRNRSVPKGDRPLWTVQMAGSDVIRTRLGAGREPIVSDPSVRVQNLSGLNLNVRNLAIMKIPAQRLGRPLFRRGDSIDLVVSLVTHAQAYRMSWTGKFALSD